MRFSDQNIINIIFWLYNNKFARSKYQIAKELELTEQTTNSIINKLCKNDIVNKDANKIFLNPNLFNTENFAIFDDIVNKLLPLYQFECNVSETNEIRTIILQIFFLMLVSINEKFTKDKVDESI